MVGRERQREGEGIGVGSDGASGAVRIAEWAAGIGSGRGAVHAEVGERDGDGVGHEAGLTEVEEAGQAVLIEDAEAAADDGFAVAEDVVGEADTRHELRVLVVDAVRGHAGIAGEHHAGGQGAELGRALVGGVVGGIECGLEGNLVGPGGEGFPAQAVVQGQAASRLPAVLRVDAGEVVAVVDQLVVALAEAGHEAHLEVRHCVGVLVGGAGDRVGGRAEAEGAVRTEHVGDVELAQLKVSAECEVVCAFHPVEIVVEGVVVAVPACEGRGRCAEVTGDGGGEIGAGVGLPDVVLHQRR